MISTKVLFVLVLAICAFGHEIDKNDQEKHDHNVGIVGGHPISIEQAPFMASIRLYGLIHWCGGSIIHERFILTSASCVGLNMFLRVYVGTDNLLEGGTAYDIEKIIIHEKYNNVTGDYDVGIIKLNESLTFGPKVSTVSLKWNWDLVKVKLGTMLNITGWGFKDPEYRISDELQQTSVPVVSKNICERFIKDYKLTPRMMCTDAIAKDPCVGDEGGPLTYNNIQIGIITKENGCAQFPSVYTRVRAVKRFILTTISTHHKKEN
ncbi:hypothetical protein PYW08_008110 [Mythimna loreyi]|uniref:Uncharacterized protein n=1 Tax=Mythimna loreyi TaxID=667449 RepID=A0ACC2QEF8_9NEOP|nr:hypothetical protein PYW08_008110 [Mythimna loreyi]